MDDRPREGRFDDLFAATYVEVLAFAIRRTGDREAAEDVAAETFAVAWRKIDDVPGEPLGWLYAVARNLISNQRRSERRRGRLLRRLSAERSGEGSGADPATAVGESDASLRALARLKESQREVLMLVAWEGADARVGSEALGCSPGAFRIRLHRARKAFEEEMTRGLEPLPPATPTEETR
ncbi:MAG: RNA polymerase sigma factor [Solirubrobacterales bacterium]